MSATWVISLVLSIYLRDARVDYLSRALDAVRGLGADGRVALEKELYTGARTRCRADVGIPTIACQLELGRASCAGRELACDVVLTNQRAEREFVDEAARIELLGASADFRAAMLDALATRRSELAADFVLAQPGTDAELPARIDRFCAHREEDPSWQRCAAALIWHIGSQP